MSILSARRFFSLLFFLTLLTAGFLTFKDYGVHWDEYNNQIFGHIWRVYALDVFHNGSILNTPAPPGQLMNWLHGPIVEIFLGFIKNLLHINELRDILFLRHFCCFLLFLMGVYFFYLLCDQHFKNWKLALLGCLFLVLSPRIFANSFYDTFDIPFLSFYIISIYTLLRWLEQRSFLTAFLHALACAVLIDTRLIGLLSVVFTFLFLGINLIQTKGRERKRFSLQTALYAVFLVTLMILGWPLLWKNPVSNFLKVLHETLQASFPYSVFYLGRFYPGDHLPWHYAPVFILITTPILYCVLFLIGCLNSIKSLFSKNIFSCKNDALFLLCFFLPLFLTPGKLYNSWRHLFFIYPVFLIFSLQGLLILWGCIHRLRMARIFAKSLLISIVILNLIQTVYVMISIHPFENVYFNRLAGENMQEIKNRFELDYWGLSYRQALEYILKTDSDQIIPVSAGLNNWPLIRNNLNILSPKDRKRFKEVPLQEAKYFITNYLQHPYEYPLPEFASIKVGNAKILEIYRLK